MALADRVAAQVATRGGRRDLTRSADPVTMEEFGYLLGRGRGTMPTKSGVTMGPQRALGLTAWYSGVRYLSESIAGLPVHMYRDDVEGRSRRAAPPWMAEPDVEQTWYGLVEHWMMSLLHSGDAFAFKLRNNAGQVIGLREIHPDRVTVGVAPDNRKRFLIDRDETVYTTREILHIPGLAYDGRRGLNPLRLHANSLGGVAAADDYAQSYFGQGTHMGGLITIPGDLSEQQAKDLKWQWDAFHKGLREAHQTGVLGNGATYTPLALKAADAQLIESRQYGVTEIARILRMPPHKLYELTRATFSNIEHQSIEAVTDSLQPWCERIEAWVNADRDLIVPGNFVEFALEGKLRGDTASRYASYQSAVGVPWMSANEARRKENLPPIPGGDVVAAPLNMATGQAAQEVPA